MKRNIENELQALRNAVNSLNLIGYRVYELKGKYLLTDNKGTSLTGYWDYVRLNHFIMGYGKAFNSNCKLLETLENTKIETVKHTPLPWWVYNPPYAVDDIQISNKEHGWKIAKFNIGILKEEEQKANASFITKAVNNHYQLLEACKHLVKIIEKENEAFYNKHIEAFNIGIETIKNAEQ